MKDKLLDGIWRLYMAENKDCADYAFEIRRESALQKHGLAAIDGSVPGNFELDMQAAGQLDDPFFGENPFRLQELENRHLWYAVTFEAAALPENPVLCFDGVDTFADIYLNGEKIGHTDNMLIPFEFAAGPLRRGENELLVHIYPVFIEARKHPLHYDTNSYQKYMQDSLYIRKPAHTFGWDIMPRILSGGIWRSVRLADKRQNRIAEFYLYTKKIENGKALIMGNYAFAVTDDFCAKYSFEITGTCRDSTFRFELNRLWHNSGIICFEVDAPQLWWPKNAGAQNLYTVRATLFYNGEPVDVQQTELGIRTVELLRTDTTDEAGSGEFLFKVNGTPIYMMGTNWVPLDAFHSRDKQRLPKALELLAESQCNMVRCWGGNVYPTEEFFAFCDKAGILVWQDFAMGCAAYPQNEFFRNAIQTEVETVVKLFRGHASLALWAGDNECDLARCAWSGQTAAPSTNKITREWIPEILSRLDPGRVYLPSSPYISDEIYESGMLLPPSEDHIWGPRDYFKNPYYFTTRAHFASEIGYHGCPAVESVKKFIPADRLFDYTGDAWQAHATCAEKDKNSVYAYRTELMFTQIDYMFGNRPQNLADFALESQLCQAEAMKFFVERFRSQKWRRTGLIWWNLVDGWPQFSDAVIDYYYNKKPAFEFIKRSQQPLCLILKEPENGRLTLVACNDYLDDRTIAFTVTDVQTGSTVLSGEATAAGNSVTEIGQIPVESGTRLYLMKWENGGKEGYNHYLSGAAPYSVEEYVALAKRGKIL